MRVPEAAGGDWARGRHDPPAASSIVAKSARMVSRVCRNCHDRARARRAFARRLTAVPRVPLLSGAQVTIVNAPDDAVVLRPPPPAEAIADVGAAVRDALRFPLAGEPLEALVPRGGRATIVIEPPALPLPGAPNDPRQRAIAAAAEELERFGVASERQTLLVAGGLGRRAGQRDLESLGLVSPGFARRFHGRVEIHDAEDPLLVPIGESGRIPLRVNRALAEPEVIVLVTAP